jgi:hypothetical protein
LASVLVSVPCVPPWIHKQVVFVLIRLIYDQRHKIEIILPTHRPYENNLAHIVVDFLKSDHNYWLNIDADNPPMANPLDLIELDLDVVGLPTPVFHFTGEKPGERPIYWNGYDYVPDEDAYREHAEKDGLQRVDAIGTGCFMAARRVFEHADMQDGAFQRTHYANGTVRLGNDLAFCQRANRAGFKIWCHYGYPCQHFHELELHEVSQAIKSMMMDPVNG